MLGEKALVCRLHSPKKVDKILTNVMKHEAANEKVKSHEARLLYPRAFPGQRHDVVE